MYVESAKNTTGFSLGQILWYGVVFNREFHSSFDNLENFVTETNEKASRAVAASRSSSSSGRGGGFSSGSSGGGGSHGGGGAF